MQLQKTILITFKRHYPTLTLNESSKLLNINRTRLFRILNGAEMKISEYESFEKSILKDQGISTNSFLIMAKECLKQLNSEKLDTLMDQMNERLFLNSILTH